MLHERRGCAGQVLDMYVSRVAYVWYVLLSASILLLFYFGGRMAGLEDRTTRFRQPAFTPDTRGPVNSARRGEIFNTKYYLITNPNSLLVGF